VRRTVLQSLCGGRRPGASRSSRHASLRLPFPRCPAHRATTTLRRARQHTRLHQRLRERREVRVRVRLRRDLPHGTLVAASGLGGFAVPPLLRVPDRFAWTCLDSPRKLCRVHSPRMGVPAAPGSRPRRRNTGRPGEQEQVLVRLRRPVRHRLRHRVRLRPDDVGAQVPPVGLEGEREPPRDTDEILRLEASPVGLRALPWRPRPCVVAGCRAI
jgi:hypothetical protein